MRSARFPNGIKKAKKNKKFLFTTKVNDRAMCRAANVTQLAHRF